MASQTQSAAGTIATEAEGSVDWSSPSNAGASDNSRTTASPGSSGGGVYLDGVQLIVSGSRAGDNRAGDAGLPGSEAYATWGGASQLWGCTLSSTVINASDFGVSIHGRDAFYGQGFARTYYLNCSNWGFSIPAGSTIDGVVVEIEGYVDTYVIYVDHVRITVYYTPAGGGWLASRRATRFFNRRK